MAALTYRGMADRYAKQYQNIYNDVLRQADYVKVMADGYRDGLEAERDRWMVKQCSLVIAVGGNEGDSQTEIIRQAVKENMRIIT